MIYDDLRFPAPPPDRPNVYINMVATIDGKTLLGTRDEDVVGLGSKFDQQVMDRLESAADAIILGGGSARANPLDWNPRCPIRIVVTRSGDVPWDAMFFTGGRAFAAGPASLARVVPSTVQSLVFDDLPSLLLELRYKLGVTNLHLLGGSELNAEFLHAGLADELFLTVAPKVKLGRDVPTYAGGEPFGRAELLDFELVESHVVGDEVFLRYRRSRL